MVKGAFRKAVLRNPTITVQSSTEVVRAMRSTLKKEETRQCNLFRVMDLKDVSREAKENLAEFEVKGTKCSNSS